MKWPRYLFARHLRNLIPRTIPQFERQTCPIPSVEVDAQLPNGRRIPLNARNVDSISIDIVDREDMTRYRRTERQRRRRLDRRIRLDFEHLSWLHLRREAIRQRPRRPRHIAPRYANEQRPRLAHVANPRTIAQYIAPIRPIASYRDDPSRAIIASDQSHTIDPMRRIHYPKNIDIVHIAQRKFEILSRTLNHLRLLDRIIRLDLVGNLRQPVDRKPIFCRRHYRFERRQMHE